MKRWEIKSAGFTIVELLIVIVVIAILAAITIVAYSGIRDRAVASQVQSALEQANKKVLMYAVDNNDSYPATLADVDISNSTSVAYQYTSDNTATPHTYAITASNGIAGTTDYYISNTQSTPAAGIAPGHNLIPWDEPNSASEPFVAIASTIDTAQYRSAPASQKFPPSTIAKLARINPITGSIGQVVTVSLWLKTDPTWNGTSSNSKIRFGNGSSGALLYVCPYNGVQTNWVQVTCSYPLTSANPSLQVSVGNDGTTGNIWFDDVSISVK